jgi:pimeloyl-ACP methyl ester carboxylesterase
MQTQRRIFTLADGRNVEYLTAGSEDGLPLLVHEGTPAGLVLNASLGKAAIDRGLRVIQLARPGYEDSTPRTGRIVADVAEDTAELLDALGVASYVSIGFSGGGPHSLACAALAAGRCRAAATVAGVAPYQAEGLDWMAGMSKENVEEFGCAVRGADVLTAYLDKEAAALAEVTGEQVAASLGSLISAADAAVLTGQVADDLAKSLRGALRNGTEGWREDDLAFVAGWGFDPAGAGQRTAIWQGDKDNMIPLAHGQWLAAHIPGARVHLEPGAGHLTMTVTLIDTILDELLDLAGR